MFVNLYLFAGVLQRFFPFLYIWLGNKGKNDLGFVFKGFLGEEREADFFKETNEKCLRSETNKRVLVIWVYVAVSKFSLPIS